MDGYTTNALLLCSRRGHHPCSPRTTRCALAMNFGRGGNRVSQTDRQRFYTLHIVAAGFDYRVNRLLRNRKIGPARRKGPSHKKGHSKTTTTRNLGMRRDKKRQEKFFFTAAAAAAGPPLLSRLSESATVTSCYLAPAQCVPWCNERGFSPFFTIPRPTALLLLRVVRQIDSADCVTTFQKKKPKFFSFSLSVLFLKGDPSTFLYISPPTTPYRYINNK